MKTKLFLALSVLTAGLNINAVGMWRPWLAGVKLAGEATSCAGQQFVNKTKSTLTLENAKSAFTSAKSAITQADFTNAKAAVAVTAPVGVIAGGAYGLDKYFNQESENTQYDAVGNEGQPAFLGTSDDVNELYAQTSAYNALTQSRLQSVFQSMKNGYNTVADKTAQGYTYLFDTAKAHPYVTGTIAATTVVGLSYAAYKLAKNYFGKAVVEIEQPVTSVRRRLFLPRE